MNKEFSLDKLKQLVRDETAFEEVRKIFIDRANEELINFVHGTLGSSNMYFLELLLFDAEGKEKSVYSPNFKSILGLDNAALEKDGKLLSSMILEDDLIKVKKVTAEIKNAVGEENFEVTFRIKKSDGKIIWLRKNTGVHFEENKLKSVFSVYVNITDFIEREESLMNLKESYRKKNASKDKFISIVSHDLRAPFTSLLGFSEILLKEEDISSDEAREYLEYIYEAAKNELQLINDLLDWSRLQTGKINLNIRRIKLADVINNSASVLTGNAIRKSVSVKIDIPRDIYVLADDRLLGQAVKNLLSNAIKFTPPEKNIFVTAGNFNEGIIEVVIKDEGVGIPENHQDKIFKIDEKFTLEGTEGEKGSGLGLTLVKEIIDKHKGNIWFYSKKNEGTEFHFTLPEASAKVLVVEDDLTNRKLIAQILKDNVDNCSIIEAENGFEALGIIDAEAPSLIISDHEMPLLNGIQLVEAAKKKFNSKFVPVIIVSGKLDKELIAKYKALGVKEIFEKPILPEEFGTTLKQFLD